MNPWIAHVKSFQKLHGCSYKEALKGASSTYQRGSGVRWPADQGMHTTGGNLKKTSKAQLKRIVAALGDKAIQKLTGMGSVGQMLKESAANNAVRLMDSGTNRATGEMETRGTGVNRLKKAGRWEQFANATIRDGIDTSGKAARVYYDSTGPMAQLGFGLKKHRRLKGKALLAAGER